jgi:hypothetical protein
VTFPRTIVGRTKHVGAKKAADIKKAETQKKEGKKSTNLGARRRPRAAVEGRERRAETEKMKLQRQMAKQQPEF